MMEGERKQIRVRTLRRIDFVEVGKDFFDVKTAEFLSEVGEENIISVSPVQYEHLDIGSQKVVNDYGVIVVYKADKGGS